MPAIKSISAILFFCLISSSGLVQAEQSVLSVDQRLAKLERMMESGGLVQLMQEIDRLKQDVNLLRGQLEEKDYEITELKRKQRELYADIEQRFQRLNRAPTPVAINTNSSTATESQQPTGAASVNISNDDKAAYQAAYALVKAQKFDAAEAQFSAFVEKFPTSDYADNAYYWLGEVQLVQKKYTDALKSFHKVFEYSESTKRSDALLKIGFAYYELEQYPQARRFLEQLLKIYPDSGAAKLAKPRLKKMESEGR